MTCHDIFSGQPVIHISQINFQLFLVHGSWYVENVTQRISISAKHMQSLWFQRLNFHNFEKLLPFPVSPVSTNTKYYFTYPLNHLLKCVYTCVLFLMVHNTGYSTNVRICKYIPKTTQTSCLQILQSKQYEIGLAFWAYITFQSLIIIT